MADAFLPQFGCFVRSQINALDRHERTRRCVGPRHGDGSSQFSFEISSDFALANTNRAIGLNTSEKNKKKRIRDEREKRRLIVRDVIM